MIARAKNISLDLFDVSGETETLCLSDSNGYYFVDVEFDPSDCVFDTDKMVNIVYPENLSIDYTDYGDCDDVKALVENAKKSKVLYLSLSRKTNKDIHYAV